MGHSDTALRLVVVDTDAKFRSELGSLRHAGVEIVFVEPLALANATMPWTSRDVVVVGVETPRALALVATICGYPEAPPVIAVGGAGFEGKSLEHVLLLAEVAGAVAGLPKPIAAPEFVMSATLARKCASAHEARYGHEPNVLRDQARAS